MSCLGLKLSKILRKPKTKKIVEEVTDSSDDYVDWSWQFLQRYSPVKEDDMYSTITKHTSTNARWRACEL